MYKSKLSVFMQLLRSECPPAHSIHPDTGEETWTFDLSGQKAMVRIVDGAAYIDALNINTILSQDDGIAKIHAINIWLNGSEVSNG